MAFYPTGIPAETWLAVGRAAGIVQRIDRLTSATPSVTSFLGGPKPGRGSACFRPKWQMVSHRRHDQYVRVWQMTKTLAIPESRLLSEGKNGMIAFSPDGRWLAAGKKANPIVSLFDMESQEKPPFSLSGDGRGCTPSN